MSQYLSCSLWKPPSVSYLWILPYWIQPYGIPHLGFVLMGTPIMVLSYRCCQLGFLPMCVAIFVWSLWMPTSWIHSYGGHSPEFSLTSILDLPSSVPPFCHILMSATMFDSRCQFPYGYMVVCSKMTSYIPSDIIKTCVESPTVSLCLCKVAATSIPRFSLNEMTQHDNLQGHQNTVQNRCFNCQGITGNGQHGEAKFLFTPPKNEMEKHTKRAVKWATRSLLWRPSH